MTEPDGPSQMLDLSEAPCCVADTTPTREWLTSPSDLPGYDAFTVAETWQITDDTFFWNADSIGALMGNLVEQAQRAGVFGVPGYIITLRHLTTGDDTNEAIEHQVTLAGPSGVMYASAPIATDHLTGDDLSGVDAAIEVLANTATVVNELLATEHRLITRGHTPVPEPSAPTRGFGPLEITAPAALRAGTPPLPPTRPSGRHR